MANIVVVFDFDKTIIDCDSDDWVVDELGVRDLFNLLFPTMSWNNLMDKMMKEIHLKGKTIDEIAECLKRAPLHPRIISAIKSAHALGCDLRIASDANVFFIETILKHHGLMDCFTEINTNPSVIDEEGRLKVFPFHDFMSSPHGCHLCPPNMCKGKVIERMKASTCADEKTKFIYLGDGMGDFCPSLKLEETDYIMPRKNFPLWDLIDGYPLEIKADIWEWSNAEEFESILLHLINTILTDEHNNGASDASVSTDCKFQSNSIHKSLHQSLSVPH